MDEVGGHGCCTNDRSASSRVQKAKRGSLDPSWLHTNTLLPLQNCRTAFFPRFPIFFSLYRTWWARRHCRLRTATLGIQFRGCPLCCRTSSRDAAHFRTLPIAVCPPVFHVGPKMAYGTVAILSLWPSASSCRCEQSVSRHVRATVYCQAAIRLVLGGCEHDYG